jgi:hypothetical protein
VFSVRFKLSILKLATKHLIAKRKPHFQTHKWSWNEQKFVHESVRWPEKKDNCAGEDQQLLHCIIAIPNSRISVVISPGSEAPRKVYSLEGQEIR